MKRVSQWEDGKMWEKGDVGDRRRRGQRRKEGKEGKERRGEKSCGRMNEERKEEGMEERRRMK